MEGTQGRGTVLIRAGKLLDGLSDNPRPDADILIRDSRIEAVAGRGQITVPPAAIVVDLPRKTVLPGLIDAHVHEYTDFGLRLFLHFGITTVKDAGSSIEGISRQWEDVKAGRKPGPRMFIIGPCIDGVPASYPESSLEVADPEDARKKLLKLIREHRITGVLFTQRIGHDVLRALVEESARAGIPISGQTWRVSAREAALAGVTAVENTSRVPELAPGDAAWQGRFDEVPAIGVRIGQLMEMWDHCDKGKLAELIQIMVEKGVFWLPSLVFFDKLSRCKEPDVLDPEALSLIPESFLRFWRDDPRFGMWGEQDYKTCRRAFEQMKRFTYQFHQAGGRVLAGTDTPNPYILPGLSLHEEMELLVSCGLSPVEAIKSATSKAAQFIGCLKEVGTVEPGKAADLTIVDGDPVSDIRVTRRVTHVVLDGAVIDRYAVLSSPVSQDSLNLGWRQK